ncbi:MAG TPA: hypothetical protein VF490_16160 [Chryseosolibacter sp.]
MKILYAFIFLMVVFACRPQGESNQALQRRVDSLSEKIENAYKPGFGEFMSGIQAHHSKLWFAGQHENWRLADFEVHEIMEAVEDIRVYQTDREESKLIGMIDQPLDSVNRAIAQRDKTFFKTAYTSLTNTCNSCHRATHFEFNIVKIPDSQPFSNQEFKLGK